MVALKFNKRIIQSWHNIDGIRRPLPTQLSCVRALPHSDSAAAATDIYTLCIAAC